MADLRTIGNWVDATLSGPRGGEAGESANLGRWRLVGHGGRGAGTTAHLSTRVAGSAAVGSGAWGRPWGGPDASPGALGEWVRWAPKISTVTASRQCPV